MQLNDGVDTVSPHHPHGTCASKKGAEFFQFTSIGMPRMVHNVSIIIFAVCYLGTGENSEERPHICHDGTPPMARYCPSSPNPPCSYPLPDPTDHTRYSFPFASQRVYASSDTADTARGGNHSAIYRRLSRFSCGRKVVKRRSHKCLPSAGWIGTEPRIISSDFLRLLLTSS